MNGEVTNAELARRLDRIDDHFSEFAKQFDETTSKLRHRDNNLEQRVTANSERLNAQAQTIADNRATLNWIVRALIGAMGLIILEGAILFAQIASR